MACRLQAFGGLRRSPFTSLWWQMESFTSLRGQTWISCISLWWHTWIVVHKHLVADGAIYKPLVEYLDRRLQAFGGHFWSLQAFGVRWSRLQAFGRLRGSPFKSLWWQMESFTSLWWYTGIVIYKPLVAERVE